MFEMGLTDVDKLYKIKCNKYPVEKLTDKLKNILYDEAVREVAFMNYINSRGGVKNGH